jgi:hypothetical protein
MTSAPLLRAGGLLLLLGSVTFAAHVVLRSIVTAAMDPLAASKAAPWVPLNVLGLAGAMLVSIGLPALFPGLARASGRGGTIGLVLLAVSWAFFGLFLSLYALLVLPWLAERAPSLVAPDAPLPVGFTVAFGLGLLSWIAGATLVAIPFIRRRARPSWIGYTMLASCLALLAGNLVIAPSGPASNLALNLLSNSGPLILLAAIGYLGIRLRSDASV